MEIVPKILGIDEHEFRYRIQNRALHFIFILYQSQSYIFYLSPKISEIPSWEKLKSLDKQKDISSHT